MRIETTLEAQVGDTLLVTPLFASQDSSEALSEREIEALIAQAISEYAKPSEALELEAQAASEAQASSEAQARRKPRKARKAKRMSKRERDKRDSSLIASFGMPVVTYWRRVNGAKRGADTRKRKREAQAASEAQAIKLEREARERAHRLANPCWYDDHACAECDIVSPRVVSEHEAWRKFSAQVNREYSGYVWRERHNRRMQLEREHKARLEAYTGGMAMLAGKDPYQAIASERSHISRSLSEATRVDKFAKLTRAKQHIALTQGAADSARREAEHRLRRKSMSARERARTDHAVQQNHNIAIGSLEWQLEHMPRVSEAQAPTYEPLPSVYYERKLTSLERGYNALALIDDGAMSEAMASELEQAQTLALRLERQANMRALARLWRNELATNASLRASVMPA